MTADEFAARSHMVPQLGQEDDVVTCSQCAVLTAFRIHRATAPDMFTVTCENCKGTSENSYSSIRRARFDGTRWVPFPLSVGAGFKNDRAIGWQIFSSWANGLFKYVTSDRLDVLTNCLIRFTPPHECNDLAECCPRLDASACEAFDRIALPDKLRRIAREKGLVLNDLDFCIALEMLTEATTKLWRSGQPMIHEWRSQIGILSLTQTPLNLAMWSHYADDHKGLVLRFSGWRLSAPMGWSLMWDMGHAMPVVYTDGREHTAETFVPAVFTHEKTAEWSYEKEWRVILPLEKCAQIVDGKIHLFKISPQTIRGVILGCRASSITREAVIRLPETDPRYSHLRIEEACVSEGGKLSLGVLREGITEGRVEDRETFGQ
jgi:hypothetical protein